MANLWQSLGEPVKALAAGWGTFAALGTFLVYLFGYLSLRFHLTSFGIEAELNLLDERYLFAGTRYLVYLLASVPILVQLLLLALVPVWLLVVLPWRLLPSSVRDRMNPSLARFRESVRSWWSSAHRLALAGIVISVVLIQVVMRQCFVLSNLLLRDSLPGPQWLQVLLLTENEGLRSLFFAGMITGVAASSALLFTAMKQTEQTGWSGFLTALLALLVGIQFLLLPINHGVLIADKTVPKVSVTLAKDANLPHPGPEAWRIWEGKESVVFFHRECEAGSKGPNLLTLQRSKVTSMEVSRFDPILNLLFRS